LIKEAIELHIADLRGSGQNVPKPTSVSAVVDVPAA